MGTSTFHFASKGTLTLVSLDAVTLTQMRYALALEDTRSFSQAAKRCHVTQSTLSLQIQKLEELLEVELFDRKQKPLATTPVGHRLLRVFESVRETTDNIPYILNQSFTSVMGRLRLGVIPTVSQALTPLLAGHFGHHGQKDSSSDQDLRLTITDLPTSELLSELKAGSLDAAILADTPGSSWLESRLLYEEEFLVYTHPDHPVAKKARLTGKDLDPDEAWILKDGHCFGTQSLGLCTGGVQGKRARGRFQYDAGSFESLRGIVDSAGGYTLLPWSHCYQAGLLNSSRVRRFESPVPVRSIHYLYRKDSVKTAIHRHLAKLCTEQLPQDLTSPTPSEGRRVIPYFD